MAATMLDHDMDVPEGWQTAWLERTFHPLLCYLTTASYGLSLTIITLGLVGFFAIRRATEKLKDNPAEARTILKMDKNVLRVARGHFAVANIYLVHVLALTLVDTYICFVVLREDMESDPEAWDSQLFTEIAGYCCYLFAIFGASFFLFPLLQMLVVSWSLNRFNKKQRSNSLADYIPEARFFSTLIAQIWCMAAFFTTAWWSAASDNSFWRFVVLQACIGSATAWLQASFAFNFRFNELENLEVGSGGVQGIIRMFGKTARIVHTYKSVEAGLPLYEDVPQALIVVDEKH